MKTLTAILLLALGVVASAQQARTQDTPVLPPAEVQRLLDGYAVIQGQEFLGLSDSQFAQFLPKFRLMQETRRRNDMERLRLIQELNRVSNARTGQIGDGEIRDRLRLLRELETRATSDVQRARDAIDQTLDLRQQARLRVFEEQMEQRKFQILMQVRQANRANRPMARPQQ